ncbi:alpha-2-macroglobulin-like [Aplochiton taeniatus]
MVAASSEMLGGTSETLCVQILDATDPIAVTLTLDTGTANVSILRRTVSQDFFKCVKFKVPTVSSDTVTTLCLSMNGKRRSMKESKILIRPAAFINIIRTDKPIYKPGQTAAQGSYTITAWNEDGMQTSYTFDIKEYVLPKYEVTLKLPNVITILDTKDKLRFCGKYTYGKPVFGTVRAKVCRKVHEWFSKEYPHLHDICKSFELMTNKNGCAFQEGNATQFALTDMRYSDVFQVEAEVEELGTGEVEVEELGTGEVDAEVEALGTGEVEVEELGTGEVEVEELGTGEVEVEELGTGEVNAEVEELGTGVILKRVGTVEFTDVIRTVTFENAPSVYRPGIRFEGQVKVTGPDSSAVADERVHVSARSGSSVSENLTLVTDRHGTAAFSLDTSLWRDGVSVEAFFKQSEGSEPYVLYLRRPSYGSGNLFLRRFYSESQSFVQILPAGRKWKCGEDMEVRAEYIIQGEGLQNSLNFFYMVMSKGSLVQHGQLKVAVNKRRATNGALTLPLHHMVDLAPVAQVVVYTLLPSGECVADSMDFPIQPCLKNKVSLHFSSVQALPGENTALTLQAHPGSLCSVRAVDQSVLLLQNEPKLNVDSVYSLLPVQRLNGYRSELQDHEDNPCWPPSFGENRSFRIPGRGKHFYPSSENNDVYTMFKNIGIKILTNSIVKEQSMCPMQYPVLGPQSEAFAKPSLAGNLPVVSTPMVAKPEVAKPEVPKETIRTFFPETWIWDLLPVGETGSVSVVKKVPDTITKWAAGAFCTSPVVGLGLAPNVGLTAFQPFFVSLTLPYSVIRGESFTLKATVFNHLSACINVKATLSNSKDFTSRKCNGCKYTLCLCGEESTTFSWIITPTSLGELSFKVSAEALKSKAPCGNHVVQVPEKGSIDTVIQTLLVEAEGTPVSVSHNALLCPADGPVESTISLQLPEKYVAGSTKAFISVLGDVMGRAMKNLDRLLAMPYGCGEQNMLLFAPNIYILNYLQSTGQLTKPIQDKATVFLASGYQRELNYKHDDGSYSAFGNNDESGNTWLTAFVMKSFGEAWPFIFVDPRHISDAKAWLCRQQRTDGCFNAVGRLFHNDMKGGVSDNVTLSAYITAALLELEANSTDPMVQRSLSCLTASVAGQPNNTYTMALLAYTFTLAGDWETRSKLITDLGKKASTQGGTVHWERAEATSKGLDSLEVEMTSYVLLALLSGPTLPGFGLNYSSTIVHWLVQQQNPYGGFASTQDTVVALKALAKYGAATYRPEGATTVIVSSAGGVTKRYEVNRSNRLLYQEDSLSEVPGQYKAKAVGKNCVFVQIALHYNIPPPHDFSAFTISIGTRADCKVPKPQVSLSVNVRSNGKWGETNMVVINIKLLSSFILEESAVQLLKQDQTVKRVDLDKGYVNIYLDGLKKNKARMYTLTLQQEDVVSDLKPAVVKIYDYYQPSEFLNKECTISNTLL